ncbi:hypothetical protein FRC00_004235, partial [Tulasnella sp. 408]
AARSRLTKIAKLGDIALPWLQTHVKSGGYELERHSKVLIVKETVDTRVPFNRSIVSYPPVSGPDLPAMSDFQEHIPPFPPEFGEDKGEFFKHYDKIQDELDNEL